MYLNSRRRSSSSFSWRPRRALLQLEPLALVGERCPQELVRLLLQAGVHILLGRGVFLDSGPELECFSPSSTSSS